MTRRLIALALLLLPIARLAAQDSLPGHTAKVTYISGDSYYIGAGREDGLVEGSEMSVYHADTAVARLKVQYVSSHQSVCLLVDAGSGIRVGDQVRFTAVATAEAAPAPTAVASHPRTVPSGGTLHGRIGARYLRVQDASANAGYGQPEGDLRLVGENLRGTGVGLSVDFRARRTTSSLTDGSNLVDSRGRAYEANVFWRRPTSTWRVAVGRQYSQSLSPVSLFDGGLVEFVKPRWSMGAFGGTQPDPDLSFSTELKEFGGFVGLHSRPAQGGAWAVTTGVIGSYVQGKANREFGFLQVAYSGPAISLFGAQELDYYEPWKVDAGESAPLSLTSTYITASVRASRLVSLFGGYDTRRNVRLYRDVVDPVTEFDDEYRQGAWGGVAFTGRLWRLGGDARTSFGGPSGTATSYTATGSLNQVTTFGLGVSGRVTRYTNPTLDGWLYALRAGADVAGPLHLELNGGFRSETEPLASPTSRSISWFGIDLDLALGRSWYLLISGNRENGDPGRTDQYYTAITWRF